MTAADYGRAVHAWKETGDLPEGALGVALEERLLLTGTDRDVLWDGFAHEVSFSVHLHHATVEIYDGPRDGADTWKASHGPEYLTATTDGIRERDGEIVIDDLKTGRFPPAVDDWPQGLSYALLPYLYAGRPSQFRCTLRVTHWPRYPKTVPPRLYHSQPVTAPRLDEHLVQLRRTVDTATPDNQIPGVHCKFCPCQPDCETFQLLGKETP